MKITDAKRIVRSFGFEEVSNNGHLKFKNEKGQMLSLPCHKEIKVYTFEGALKKVGIKKELWKESKKW